MAEESKKLDLVNMRRAAHYAKRMWPLVKPLWPQLLLVVTGMLAYAAGYGMRIAIIGEFIKLATAPDSLMGDEAEKVIRRIAPLAGVLFGGAILMAVGTYLKHYFQGYVKAASILNLQRRIVDQVLKQPIAFFNKERKGALMSRMSANARAAGQLLQVSMDVVLGHPLTMISVLGVLLYISPFLTLLTFVIMPIVLMPVIYFSGKIRRATHKKFKKMEASSNFVHQMLDGIRVVKSYRLEEAQRAEHIRVSDETFRHARRVSRYKGASRFGVEITYNTLMAAALFGVGLVMSTQWFVDAGGFGVFAAFFAGLIFLYDPARKMGHTLNEIQESTAGLDRAFELVDREPAMIDRDGARDAPHTFDHIEFRDVSFEYVEDRPVLRDINFKVARGKMVAFVGGSGVGKSTLMDLIPRFYDPTGGAITVDGVDLRDFKAESWLRNIAIVSQDTFLFNTTIRENILLGRPTATEEEVIAAAKAAHIWHDIEAMPEGLNTRLGDRGVTISGGQRQRVAIARAFLRKSPILLLDEATSALDTQSEREVQKALDELIHECTVFAVAHRLSTIRNADLILVMHEGRIIERGTHDELLLLEGNYAAAWRLQHGGHTPAEAA